MEGASFAFDEVVGLCKAPGCTRSVPLKEGERKRKEFCMPCFQDLVSRAMEFDFKGVPHMVVLSARVVRAFAEHVKADGIMPRPAKDIRAELLRTGPWIWKSFMKKVYMSIGQEGVGTLEAMKGLQIGDEGTRLLEVVRACECECGEPLVAIPRASGKWKFPRCRRSIDDLEVSIDKWINGEIPVEDLIRDKPTTSLILSEKTVKGYARTVIKNGKTMKEDPRRIQKVLDKIRPGLWEMFIGRVNEEVRSQEPRPKVNGPGVSRVICK